MLSYPALSSSGPTWSAGLESNSSDKEGVGAQLLLQTLLDLQWPLYWLSEPLSLLQVSVGCLSLSGCHSQSKDAFSGHT